MQTIFNNNDDNQKPKQRKRTNKRKQLPEENNLRIYYNNINGLLTKQDSLCHILQMRQPDLVTLCETKLHKNSTFNITGYEVIKSSLKAGKEGIIVAAKLGTFNTIQWIFESDRRNIATAEITYPEDTLRVIVVHGPQEDALQEEREDFFNDLKAEVERCVSSSSRLLLTGDFNARIDKSSGELQSTKTNGRVLKEIVDAYNLTVLNLLPNTEGKWTRIQRKSGTEVKSVIDYVISDSDTGNGAGKTVVDEEKMYTPYRSKKDGNGKSLVFTDHCAITTALTLKKGTNKKKHKPQKMKIWVIDEPGLQKFQELSSGDISSDLSSVSNPYEVWEESVEQIMHKCFVKRTVTVGKTKALRVEIKARKMREILKEVGKRGKIQRKIVKLYLSRLIELEAERNDKMRAEKLNETVANLTTDDVLSTNAFWKLRKSVTKNSKLQLQAVFKQEGGITTNCNEVKDEVRKEFESRLRNREAVSGWEEYVQSTNVVVKCILDGEYEKGPDFSEEELTEAVKRLKTGIAPDYYGMHSEIFHHLGTGHFKALLQVLNSVKNSRKIPEKWRNVLVTMIYKNKGSHMDLEKYRGIFLTVIVSKLFELLLKKRMKPSLEKISLFQTGSRDGKGPPDMLFLLRGCIDHSKYMNKSLYITSYDFRQAFDSLWLQDSILTLRRLGVEDYILKLIYELNRKAIVQVKTPFGLTEPAEVIDIVKQGTILGSSLCSASTGEYCQVNKGVTVGDLQIATLAYVDDIYDLNQSDENTIEAHQNAQVFAMRKKQSYAPEKCNVMLVNRRNKTNLVVPKLKINDEIMEEVHQMVCLGDVFNSKGNNDALMEDRVKRGTASMVSIHGFMREISVGVYTVSVFLLLYSAIFLASILFNAQAWSNLTEKNMHTLSTVQLKFLKKIMSAKQATANSFVYLELGVLPVEFEVHKRQLAFLHHIVHLRDDDPVRKMWEYQKRMPNYNNWWNGIEELMKTYGITLTEEQIKNMSKDTFKQKVKKAVTQVAFDVLRKECQTKEKTKRLVYEEYRTQPYLTSMYHNHAKIVFKCRSKTLGIKQHMKYEYKENLHCRWCGVSEETLQHVVNCGASGPVVVGVDKIIEECRDLEQMKVVAQRIENFLERVEV